MRSMSSSDTVSPALHRFALLTSYVKRMTPVLLGNMMEWYEFSLYQYLIPELLEQFFDGDETTAQLWFAVFSFTRILGGFLFGWFADTHGRQPAIVLSVSGMFVFIFAQALLPLPNQLYIGTPGQQIGLVLLVICHIMQGVCTGGQLAIIIPYILETAPADVRCTALSLYTVFSSMAFAFAASVVTFLSSVLRREEMLAWGWRLPLLLATGPAVLSWSIRRRFYETEEFKQSHRRAHDGLSRFVEAQRHAEASSWSSRTLTSTWPPALAAPSREPSSAFTRPAAASRLLLIAPALTTIGVSSASLVAFYESVSYLQVVQTHGGTRVQAWSVHMAQMTVSIISVVVAAHLVDVCRAGPQVTLKTGLALIVLFWTPAHIIQLTWLGELKVTLFIITLGYGLMIGITSANMNVFAVDHWPVEVRCRCFGVCQNVAAAIASFTPLAHAKLTSLSELLPALYPTVFAVVGLLAIRWDAKLQEQSIVQLMHFPRAAGVELVPTGVRDGAVNPSATSEASETPGHSCGYLPAELSATRGLPSYRVDKPLEVSMKCTPEGRRRS